MSATGGVVQRTAVVVNRRGLHARAAALVARVAGRFEAEVTVSTTAGEVSALSIMGMLMLGASTGTTLHIKAEGVDATAAADALAGRQQHDRRRWHLADECFSASSSRLCTSAVPARYLEQERSAPFGALRCVSS